MTATRPNPDEPQRAERPLRLVLELNTDGGIPNGTARAASGPPVAFHGWIGLMSAVSSLLADPDPVPARKGRATGLSIRAFP